MSPELSKGLEFDLVVLVYAEQFGTGIEGAVGRYVAMTRATQQLVVLTSGIGGVEPQLVPRDFPRAKTAARAGHTALFRHDAE
jgi:hypothetical protein